MNPETPAQPSPGRRWFQIHLSTAFFTMLAAGGIMCVFFTPKYVQSHAFSMSKLGFPWTAACKIHKVERNTETRIDFDGETQFVQAGDYVVAYEQLFADIAAILAMLFIVAYLLEWPIRRDEIEKSQRLLKRAPLKRISARVEIKAGTD